MKKGTLVDATIIESAAKTPNQGKDDEARKEWKILSGYHRRSLAETVMFRFKKMFGSEFRSREMRRQKAELYAKSIAMNTMTKLGMPRGEWVMS